jgi:hypothetical protein
MGLSSLLESTSSTITEAVSGAEELLLGDATTDAVASATGDAMAGIELDSIAIAAGDAGAGILSMLPSWLISGGLAALASEVAFGLFAIFVLLKAGGSAAGGVVEAAKEGLIPKENNDGAREELVTLSEVNAIAEVLEGEREGVEQTNDGHI